MFFAITDAVNQNNGSTRFVSFNQITPQYQTVFCHDIQRFKIKTVIAWQNAFFEFGQCRRIDFERFDACIRQYVFDNKIAKAKRDDEKYECCYENYFSLDGHWILSGLMTLNDELSGQCGITDAFFIVLSLKSKQSPINTVL